MTGQPLAIDEPASAVAASLCLVARDRGDRRTPRHPETCSWCDWPADVLRSMLEAFNEWAGYDERQGTYARHVARVFAELPQSRQAELVRAAQGLEDVPAAAPDPAPAATGGTHSPAANPDDPRPRSLAGVDPAAVFPGGGEAQIAVRPADRLPACSISLPGTDPDPVPPTAAPEEADPWL